jgi:two-component system sensor histidine kinase MtrB
VTVQPPARVGAGISEPPAEGAPPGGLSADTARSTGPAGLRTVGAQLRVVGAALGRRLRGAAEAGWSLVPPAMRSAGQRAASRLYAGWAPVHGLWRRSLQVRVVTITLVMSALLVGAFGWLVAGRITSGLLEEKLARANRQVEFGGVYASQQLEGVTQRDDPRLRRVLPAIVTSLATSSGQGGHIEVVLIPSGQPVDYTDGLSRPNPAGYQLVAGLGDLRREIRRGTGNVAYQYVNGNPDGGEPRPYLVYGTLVTGGAGPFELYYAFPLDDEVSNVNLVRSTVALTSVTLVVLMAVVAALVTRLVVHPVRLAARTAQRLSAGLLDQRMSVRGEDDLAQLAASFNQMAANLQRQIFRLEEMSRLQRRFTSDVSHELRTPLTTVRMAADLIFSEREEFDPAVARSAELLQTELDRFESLLSDLLEISRFDAGFAALDAEPTDLVAVVERVVDRLAPVAERLGSEITMVLPEPPVVAEVDPRRLERVLRNLTGNAIEHSERSPVEVTLGVGGNAVAITVRDHGVGLKPGEEKLVFNRFWRADPSRARQTGGTGLGLSISLEDARLHGGWLEAWGAPGQGAQFRLTLPVQAGDRLVSSPLRLVPPDVRSSADGAGGPPEAAVPAAADIAGDTDPDDSVAAVHG